MYNWKFHDLSNFNSGKYEEKLENDEFVLFGGFNMGLTNYSKLNRVTGTERYGEILWVKLHYIAD